MRPLPRVFAVTTGAICRSEDFSARAAAIAAAGPAVVLVVRAPDATTAAHAASAEQVAGLAQPTGARVIVHARPDLARAVGAAGVQLRRQDLAAADARRVLGDGWIGVSVHDRGEAAAALAEGADFLVAGNVFRTASHCGSPAKGLHWLSEICALGLPVIAIGGITAERVAEVRRAGAWGVAAISALWETKDPAAAARLMAAACEEAQCRN